MAVKTMRVEGYDFEYHEDDGMVVVPEGDSMAPGSILPLSVLREFVRRAKKHLKKRKARS